MKILNFGSCNIDYVYDVDHIVLPGETLSSDNLEIFPGGKGLNQSIALARAGACVCHAGCIGKDGEWLKTLLKDNGADVTHLRTLDAQTGHAIIQLDKNAENSIVLFCGSNRMITKDFVDEVIGSFDSGDILLLQNEINELGYIIEKAHEKGMHIFVNPAPFTPEFLKLPLDKITWLILNEIEAQGFGGKTTPEENIASLKNSYPALHVVLTIGKRGCIYAEDSRLIYQPSYKVEALDTTAAGDTFIGYFLAMLAYGKNVREALNTASVASALTVSKKGAASSIPFLKEVKCAKKTLVPRSPYNRPNYEELILSYVSEHLEDANLPALAQTLGYSVDHTGQLVKKLTGVTFSELLQTQRCAKAAELLANTDLSIGQIIYRVGYENESFFRSVFKGRYGKLPLEYRKYVKGEMK